MHTIRNNGGLFQECGLCGVPGDPAAKLVEEEGDPEVEAVTQYHQWERAEIALVHRHRQNNAMKKTVHLVKFVFYFKSPFHH